MSCFNCSSINIKFYNYFITKLEMHPARNTALAGAVPSVVLVICLVLVFYSID